MTRIEQWPALLVLAVAMAATARGSLAGTNDNPYLAIVERNAFGLHPPAPPPAPTPTAPTVRQDIKFTGISRDPSGRKAYLVVTENPTQRGQQPTVEYYCLGEGQREGDIEVKSIDEKAETVTILKGAESLTLNFKDNGNTPTTAAAALPPGVVMPGAIQPFPRPGTPAAVAAAYRERYAPNYARRYPISSPVAGTTEAENEQNLRSLPTRSLRAEPTPVPQVDPAAQRVLMEISSQLNAGKNMPPMPPLNLPPVPGQ